MTYLLIPLYMQKMSSRIPKGRELHIHLTNNGYTIELYSHGDVTLPKYEASLHEEMLFFLDLLPSKKNSYSSCQSYPYKNLEALLNLLPRYTHLRCVRHDESWSLSIGEMANQGSLIPGLAHLLHLHYPPEKKPSIQEQLDRLGFFSVLKTYCLEKAMNISFSYSILGKRFEKYINTLCSQLPKDGSLTIQVYFAGQHVFGIRNNALISSKAHGNICERITSVMQVMTDETQDQISSQSQTPTTTQVQTSQIPTTSQTHHSSHLSESLESFFFLLPREELISISRGMNDWHITRGSGLTATYEELKEFKHAFHAYAFPVFCSVWKQWLLSSTKTQETEAMIHGLRFLFFKNPRERMTPEAFLASVGLTRRQLSILHEKIAHFPWKEEPKEMCVLHYCCLLSSDDPQILSFYERQGWGQYSMDRKSTDQKGIKGQTAQNHHHPKDQSFNDPNHPSQCWKMLWE